MLARPGRAGPHLPLTRGSLKYMSLRSSMVNQRFRKPSVCCGSERACDWQVSRGRPASSWQQRTPEGRVQASPGQSPHSFTSATGHATRRPCTRQPSSLHTAPPSCSSRCPSPPWALDGGSGLTSPHTCTSPPGPPRLLEFPSPSHIMPQGVARRGPLAARVHSPVGEEAGRTERARRVQPKPRTVARVCGDPDQAEIGAVRTHQTLTSLKH